MFLARCAASTAAAPAVVASSSSCSRSVASARDEVSGFRSSRSVHHLRRRRRPSPAATAPRPLRRSGHRDGDCKARIFTRAKAPDDEGDEGAESPDAADAAQTVNAMMREDLGLDVDAIRTLIDEDPEVREQERLMAFEARNAASLQVDAKMAEEESKIAREYGSKGTEAGMTLKVRPASRATQEAALAELEAKSAAVLAAEAKVRAIQEERAQLLEAAGAEGNAGAGGSSSSSSSSSSGISSGCGAAGKWGSSVAADVDEAAEKIQSAKAGTAAAASGTLLSVPLLLSQSSGTLVTLESVAGVAVSCLVFGVTYRYAVRDDTGNDQLKGGVVGAFGLTRGLGAADVYLHGSDQYDFASWAEVGLRLPPASSGARARAALLVGESMLTFAFAAAALEAGFKRGLIKPFPMRRAK